MMACVKIAAATLSGNSLMQTVHTHSAFFSPNSKIGSSPLAESNGSLPPGL